ncbi:DUF2163 domain-containing protein [Lysobacter fragariae]
MPKTIPAQLVTHKALLATTLAFCMRIGPLRDNSYIGLTGLDRDIAFDFGDGAGSLTYHAHTGIDLSQFAATSDLSVDNAEARSLQEQPTWPNTGITEAMIDRGDLSGIEFVVFEVNYNDLTAGRREIFGSGLIGEVKVFPGGLIGIEQRSWSQVLKQAAANVPYLKTCRAGFGSQVGDERYPCKFALAGEWVNGTVTAIGAEVTRDFTASALAQAADYFAPGVVEWLTGGNAGMSREIESFASGGVVALRNLTKYPVQVGDTFRIRRDCTKAWSGHNSCETYNNRPNFRAEPYIPDSEANTLSVGGG